MKKTIVKIFVVFFAVISFFFAGCSGPLLEDDIQRETNRKERRVMDYPYFENNKTPFVSKNKDDTTYIVFKVASNDGDKYDIAINNYIYNVGGEIVSASTGNVIPSFPKATYVLKLPKDAPYVNTFAYAIEDCVSVLPSDERKKYEKILKENEGY